MKLNGVELIEFSAKILQSVRVFASQINHQARSADQNVSPGTVVDTGVVHPIWNEFFLTSHSSPQVRTTNEFSVSDYHIAFTTFSFFYRELRALHGTRSFWMRTN
jgi:hypothetical protein